MAKSEKMKQRILKVASQNFFRHGFYRVSMDSLVSEVRTSKSTIYEHFSSKEDLIRAVLVNINQDINEKIQSILKDETKNFHEKLTAITQFTGEILAQVGEDFLSDLRVHTPEIWEEYLEMREERLENLYGRLLKSGINEDLLRKDINEDFLLLVYTKLTELAVEPDMLQELPMTNMEAYAALSALFLEGALTENGRRKLMK